MRIPWIKPDKAGAKAFARSALFTAALAALIVLGVFFLPGKLQGISLANVLRPKPPAWQGVLHVWQVNTWRVGRGSRTAVVQAAARRFETRNVGVYVELDNVTEEMLRQRLTEGRLPDVLLFPDNWSGMDAEMFLTLDASTLPTLSQPFASAFQREPRAVPWMAGSQLVLVNNALCRSAGVEPPMADKSWNLQALLDFSRQASTSRRKKNVLALSGAQSNWLPLAMEAANVRELQAQSLLADKVFSQSIDGAREPFAAGRCAVLLGTQWEAALMERLAAKGKAFEYSVLPLPGDVRPTLNIQYAAVYASGDEARDASATAFIATLLSQPVQKSIAENSACLAVIPNATERLPDSDVEKFLWNQLPRARAPLPWQTLEPTRLEQALGGDKGAALVLGEMFAN